MNSQILWFCFIDSCRFPDLTLRKTYLKVTQSDTGSLQIYILFVYPLISLQVTPNAGRINLSQGTPITWWALTVCLYSLTTSEEGDSWSVTERQSVSGEYYEALSLPLSFSPFPPSPLYKGVILSSCYVDSCKTVFICSEDKESTFPLVLNPHKTHSYCSCFGA